MAAYLLDTNHLGAALKVTSDLRERIAATIRTGNRFGTCVPVLCELESGFRPLERRIAYSRALARLLGQVRVRPLEEALAPIYGEIYQELRQKGRVLSQVDMMLAAMCRHKRLTLLTSDRDFEALPDLRVENWVAQTTGTPP